MRHVTRPRVFTLPVSMAWRALLTGVAALAALGVPVATAHVPEAARIVSAVARQNRASGRTGPLQLEVLLRSEDRQPIGRGLLVTHPTGLARLELRGANGIVERHLLQGSEHTASRFGQPLERPRAFLPPLFLMQTESSLGLRAGLSELGADLAAIGLAPCGDSDCYVLGDPKRVPPPRPEPGAPTDAAGSGASEPANDPFELGPSVIEGPFATLWVDIVSFEVKRIDTRNGVRVWLGPPKTFGRVQAPEWFRIDEPGKSPVRFDVLGVSQVDAPAAAFSRSWLAGPEPSPAEPADAPQTGPLDGAARHRAENP